MPKTGTTTLQRYAARHRKKLRPLGLWYPSLREISSIRHFGHHDIARALVDDKSSQLSPTGLSEFFAHFARTKDKTKNALISSEFFFQSTAKSGDRILSELKKNLKTSDVVVVIILRRQYDYIRSSYEQNVKASRRQTTTIRQFMDVNLYRCEYLRILEIVANVFPNIRVETFERLRASGDLIGSFFGLLGIDVSSLPGESANISPPIEFIEFKRLWNRLGLDDTTSNKLRERLEAMASTGILEPRKDMEWISPAEIVAFQQAFDDDNEAVRGLYAPHLPAPLFPPISPRETVFDGLSAQRAVEIASWALTRKEIPGAPLPPILDRVIERLRVAVGRRT
jgi:hypothetical protein